MYGDFRHMLYFVVNPTSRSGKGAEIWAGVKAELDKRKIAYELYETKYKGHAKELAAKICNKPDEDIRLVALGGDGTVNEVVNGMEHFDRVRFGVISTGSGNDFARGLQIKDGPLEQLEKLIAVKNERIIDLGLASWEACDEPRYFAVSAGIGMDAIVVRKTLVSRLKKILNAIHLGKLVYPIITVQTLFSMTMFDLQGTAKKIVVNGTEKEEEIKQRNKVIFAAAMNFRSEGGGIPMVPHATADDGKLSVCVISDVPKWLAFFYLPFLIVGKQKILKQFETFDCEQYETKYEEAVTLHLDGEYVGEVRNVIFTCVPQKLRVII